MCSYLQLCCPASCSRRWRCTHSSKPGSPATMPRTTSVTGRATGLAARRLGWPFSPSWACCCWPAATTCCPRNMTSRSMRPRASSSSRSSYCRRWLLWQPAGSVSASNGETCTAPSTDTRPAASSCSPTASSSRSSPRYLKTSSHGWDSNTGRVRRLRSNPRSMSTACVLDCVTARSRRSAASSATTSTSRTPSRRRTVTAVTRTVTPSTAAITNNRSSRPVLTTNRATQLTHLGSVHAAVVLEDEAERGQDHEHEAENGEPPREHDAQGGEPDRGCGEQRPPAVRAEEAEFAGCFGDFAVTSVFGPHARAPTGDEQVEAHQERQTNRKC